MIRSRLALRPPFRLARSLVMSGFAFASLGAMAVPVNSTLSNVTILGNVYDVTFSQNLADANGSTFTAFNDVFGTGTAPAPSFSAGTIQAATQALLAVLATHQDFDVNPGTPTGVGGAFAVVSAVDGNNVTYLQASVNTSYGNYASYLAGTYTGLRTSPYSGAFVSFAAAAPVPEPASIALMLTGIGLVGAMARRRRA